MESAESEFQAIFKVSSLKLFLLALLGTLLAVATSLVLYLNPFTNEPDRSGLGKQASKPGPYRYLPLRFGSRHVADDGRPHLLC